MSANIEHLIQDIESTECPLGPTFRALFDLNIQKEFAETLQSKIKILDKDIEKLCSHYYQGFTESIHELPLIRNDLSKLKKDMLSINQDVQIGGKKFQTKIEEAVKYEKILKNIEIGSDFAKICIPVLAGYLKLQYQLKNKRYYAALKTLEIFENSYLPSLSLNIQMDPQLFTYNLNNQLVDPSNKRSSFSYPFHLAKALKSSICDVRENIKKASESELSDFLEIIRQRSGYVGKIAIKNQAFRMKFFNLNAIANRLKLKNALCGDDVFNDNKTAITFLKPSANENPGALTCKAWSNAQTSNNSDVKPSKHTNPKYTKRLVSQHQDTHATAVTLSAVAQPFLVNGISTPLTSNAGHENNPFDSSEEDIADEIKKSDDFEKSEFTNIFEGAKTKSNEAILSYSKMQIKETSDRGFHQMDYESNGPSIIEQGIDPSKLIDFSPLYRCLHINSMMGNGDKFIEYYRKQREKQIKLILQPSHAQINESLEIYQSYLYEITGFFLVENYVMCSTRKSGLINKPYLNELWMNTSMKSIALLKTKSAYSTDPLVLMELKNLIILFTLTLKEYNYSVNRVFELLTEIREQYHEILRMQMVQLFRADLANDNFHPMICQTPELFNQHMNSDPLYPFLVPHFNNQMTNKYPKYFPFSQSLPLIFDHIRTYLLTCHTFSRDFPNISSAELYDILHKAIINLLTRTLGGCLAALIKSTELYIDQLIQISINLDYLEKGLPLIDQQISQLSRSITPTTSLLSGIHTQNLLKDIKDETEIKIRYSIKQCIEKIMSNAKYDWMSNTTTTTTTNKAQWPQDFVIQFQDFFNKYLLSYPNTDEKAFQTIIDYAFQILAQSLLNYLTRNDKIRMISLQSLQNYQKSLAELIESFNTVISGDTTLKSLNLFRHFREINQLLNLIIKLDWGNYLMEYGKPNSMYNLVPSKTATLMLEKLMLGEKQKDNLISNMISTDQKKSERKKINETLLKQLKQIQTTERIEPTNIKNSLLLSTPIPATDSTQTS